MDLSWLQGWSLHSLILKNMELEKYFDTELFPKMSVGKMDSGLACYRRLKNDIRYNELKMNYMLDGFDHIFFHELMHSTACFGDRFVVMRNLTHHTEYVDIYQLEERIADTAAFVLIHLFSPNWDKNCGSPTLKYRFKNCMDTKFALPWGEVEQAVKCYLKDKDCPKLESALQYYKGIVSQVTTVYEGQFNGQLIIPEKTTDYSKSSRDAGSFIGGTR